jgi:hypothetical protein
MDDLDQLHAALLKADAAGDTASAKILADHIRQVTAQAQQPSTQAPPKQTPGALANAWDGVKNLGIGLYRGVMDPIDGGAQLASHGVASAVHAIAPGSSADKFFAEQARGVDAINTNREKQYQELTPGSVAAGVGRVGGNIIVPVKGTQAARGASLGAKLASGITTGAVVGAAQPVFNAGEHDMSGLVTGQEPVDYWSEKAKQVGLGAALGGGLSGLAATGGAVVNALRPVLSPKAAVGDQLVKGLAKAKAAAQANPTQEAAGSLPSLTGSRDAHDVLARLQSAAPLVEGSLPTTAQVAGVPELVMAEKTLKNNPAYRGPFEDRAIANNQARLAQLLKVAKTPADLQAAINARAAETKPLYDAARTAELPVDDTLGSLLARPSAQAAIARGKKLAAERGEQVGLDGGAPAANSTSAILDASGKPFSDMVPARPTSISGNMLQYLKMGLDDLQSEGRTQGIGSHEAKALSDTQDALRQWMERNSPDFSKANAAYAKASQPINTMQAGQDLYGALSNGALNSAGDVAPGLPQYRAQLAKALKSSPYGIDPEAQQTLEAIQQDLQRESISNSIKSPGSDTFFNAQAPNWLSGQLFGQNLDGKSLLGRVGAGIGGFLTGGTMGAAGGALGAQKVGQFVGNRVNTEFQNAMLDPQYFAKLLGEALDRQASDPTTFQKLAPAWTRGATAGAENVMSPNP